MSKKDKDIIDGELKACPICNLYLRHSNNSTTTTMSIAGYEIKCGHCKFSSGIFSTYDSAVLHWNLIKDLVADLEDLKYRDNDGNY